MQETPSHDGRAHCTPRLIALTTAVVAAAFPSALTITNLRGRKIQRFHQPRLCSCP